MSSSRGRCAVAGAAAAALRARALAAGVAAAALGARALGFGRERRCVGVSFMRGPPSSRAARPAHAGPAAPSGPGRTFATGGVTIWYEVRGSASGRPLIMVNGGPGFDHTYVLCSDAWDVLARSRRVVFYDQRGDGRSSALKSNQSCTLADQVADLEA